MSGRAAVALWLGMAAGAAGCGGTLDAGRDQPHGLLPVDERNPVIIDNDQWSDNWMGEYAMLLAQSGGPPIVGIIAGSSKYWGDATANAMGWTNLVTAARTSGLKNIPDVTTSMSMPLAKPADGLIEHTAGNGSPGAHRIVELSQQWNLPLRPVVVLTGLPLTDVADAYLLDNSVVERVVVVAALGSYTAPNGVMGGPNGDLDPWANWIVAQKFKYVQVCTYYDQTTDVTTAELPNLPQNPLGAWMTSKQPNLYTIPTASDQVTALAVGLSSGQSMFVTGVQIATPDTSGGFDATMGLPLVPSATGNVWVVTAIASPLAKARLWQMLLDPHSYGS
jgi:hypothetical protein